MFSDTARTQVFRMTPNDIISKYEEGIAEYDYLDARRIVAFKVLPEHGWMIGVEKPVGVAYSELQNIKKYIVYVCIVSVILVSFFSWVAIRYIIKPYYQDIEGLNEQLADSVKRLSTLHKVSRSIQRILPLDEMLEESIKGIAEALGYDRIFLHLIHGESDTAKLEMALVGNQMISLDSLPENVRELKCIKENGVIERAMVDQEPYYIKSALTNELVNRDRAKALGVREFAVVPLVAESKCIGSITVDNPSSGKRIRNRDIETLMTFAGHVGLAIERSTLHTELHNYASDVAATDSLTGLYNWSHFMGWLEEEMASSQEQRSPLCVIWAQAFCLKAINEKYGYAAGNIALRQLGQIVASTAGQGEIGARFGGGEFVLGLPDCPENQAEQIATELKKRAQELQFKEEGLEEAELQINVSFTRFRGEESTPDFLERARKQTTSQQPD
jgi:diguanylate cyclase (GGDEF)-like protein